MNTKNINGKTVVYLEGEINAQEGVKIKNKILDMFSKNYVVVLSFKGVVYMNSSGLREIIDLLKNATKDKKSLSLCDMSKDIREMFSFTGLDRVFKIYDKETEAVG